MSTRLDVAIEQIGRALARPLDARERELVGTCLGNEPEPLPFVSLAFLLVRDGVSTSVATAAVACIKTYMDRTASMAGRAASATVAYRPRVDATFEADVKRTGWVRGRELGPSEREVLAACLGEQEERLAGVFFDLAEIFIEGKVSAATARAVSKLVELYVDATITTAGKFAATLVRLEHLKPGSTADTENIN